MSNKKVESCPLCGDTNVALTKEHVWPRWLLSRWPTGEPYVLHRNDEPVMNKRCMPVTNDHVGPTFLRLCSPCNAELDRRFEKTAKAVVRTVLDTDANVVLSADDAERFGAWVLKTLLLLTLKDCDWLHMPKKVSSDPWVGAPADVYRWLVRCESAPEFLSVWATRLDDQRVEPPGDHLFLPTVQPADGGVAAVTRHRRGGIGPLRFDLLHHPRWVARHPLEVTGQALQIWPPMGGPLNIGALAGSARNEMRFVEGVRLVLSVEEPDWRSFPELWSACASSSRSAPIPHLSTRAEYIGSTPDVPPGCGMSHGFG